jgi:hypothetical protein
MYYSLFLYVNNALVRVCVYVFLQLKQTLWVVLPYHRGGSVEDIMRRRAPAGIANVSIIATSR